jgi:hypothetical protein
VTELIGAACSFSFLVGRLEGGELIETNKAHYLPDFVVGGERNSSVLIHGNLSVLFELRRAEECLSENGFSWKTIKRRFCSRADLGRHRGMKKQYREQPERSRQKSVV